MQARVWRLYACGQPIERDKLRRAAPAHGELQFRHRLTGRGSRWDVFLAVLMYPDYSYVIPALDVARLEEVRGRWLHLTGKEVVPRSNSLKRPNPDYYLQAWWCRIDGAVSIKMSDVEGTPGSARLK